MTQLSIDLEWTGPYVWPGYQAPFLEVPRLPGAYLWTVDYQSGYLIYAVGITRRIIPKRLREHTRNYLTGVYTVLDIEAMQAGRRREVWHGFWMKRRSMDRVADYEARCSTIKDAAHRQLAGFRVFVAEVPIEPRLLERLEAALMAHIYRQPSPYSDIPDRGMMLAARWPSETPVTIRNRCAHLLYAMPQELEI